MKALSGTAWFRILGILILAIALFTVGVLVLESIEPQRLLLYNLFLLIVLAAALVRWVCQPLGRLVRGLRARDPALLASLASQNSEFGQLARLIQEFFQQQQQLATEIQERRQAEQRLRLYSRAIEHSPSTVIITNRAGIIEYVNPKFVETSGYSRTEAIGANPRFLKSGKTTPEHYARLWQTITSGGEWRGEFRNQRKDGALYWESASIAPIHDDNGAITHFVAVKEDITLRKKIEAALRASELKYRNVFATVGDAILMLDSRDGRILDANPAACKLYGYSRDELLALRDRDLAAGTDANLELSRTISKRFTDYPQRRKDGTIFPADLWVRHFTHKGYEITVAAIRDMTPLKEAEQKIVRLSHCYAALGRTSAAIMRCPDPQELFWQICRIVVDLDQIRVVMIEFVDPATDAFHLAAHAGTVSGYLRYLATTTLSSDPGLPEGRGPTGMAFRQGAPIVCNDFLDDPNTQIWRPFAEELGVRAGAAFPLRRNDRVVGCLSAYAADRDFFDADLTDLLTQLAGEVSFALDLYEREDQRRTAEDRIRHLANHDTLTGLPNRTLLLDRLSQALHSAQRAQHCVGLLFLDLDHFKTINDSQGHDVGDQLLQAISQRLRNAIRQEDTLARQGGDEFILVLSNLSDPTAAGLVAEHLLQAMQAPFILNHQTWHVGASIGISIYPVDSTDPSTLIRYADSAMYRAKDMGRACYAFFTSELNVQVSERFDLGNELRRALERDEFVLHYQPQIDLATGRPVGVEALIRWQHPQRGLLPPARFITAAEETGLIGLIGEWTLRTACAQGRLWQDANLPPLSIAVNLSAKQWLQPNLQNQVIEVLESADLEPRFLELEITESLLMRDTDKMIETMRQLRAHGVQFAVDDFGVGYSCLGYLKRFPVNRIKIDQSFIHDIPDDPDDVAIATAIIQMGKSLRLNVVAEGVETSEQLRFLSEQGCDVAQGYHFSKALPAGECAEYLTRLMRAT